MPCTATQRCVVCFVFLRVNCTVLHTYPAALHIKTLQRQRSLHCALIHVPITSGFDAQCPVGLGNLASKESIPSNAYYTNTVLFIF